MVDPASCPEPTSPGVGALLSLPWTGVTGLLLFTETSWTHTRCGNESILYLPMRPGLKATINIILH